MCVSVWVGVIDCCSSKLISWDDYLVSHLELGKVTGTSKVSLAEGNTRAGLSLATIEADISVAVGDEGQFTQGLGEVDGAVFTVAVVEGVGSRDNTVEESINGLVEGPSTADDVGSSVRDEIIRVAQVVTIRTD